MPSITVQFPDEVGGSQTIKLKEGQSPQEAIDRRWSVIQGELGAGGTAASGSDLENFRAGIGSGLVNTGKQLTNLALPDFATPEWASDESIDRQTTTDEDLLKTKAGLGGKITGEIAASALPVTRAGALVSKGARALSATSKGGKYLTRTLQKGMGRGAVEGATVGAIYGGPDERVSGAKMGAAFGGVLGGAGTVLGKTLGKGQVTKITNEAKQLQKLTDTFIPLSQSAEKGMTRMIYNAFLANVPGVGSKVRGQYQHALDDMRRFVSEHAAPDSLKFHNTVKLTGRESVDELITKMKPFWDTAFDSIKPWPIKVFDDIQIPKFLEKALKGHGNFKIPRKGALLTGDDILQLKTAIGEVIASKGVQQSGAARAYTKKLDELLKRNLNPSGKGRGQAAKALDDYQDAAKYWGPWQSFKRAAEKADDLSQFSPGQIAKSAKRGEGPVLPGKTHEAPLSTQRRVGQLSADALEDFPSKQGLFQTLAATSPMVGAVAGGMAAGAAGFAVALPAVIALGRIGASKGLQKYLSGQTRGQRLNKVLMRKYKDELQRLGATARQATLILGENQ